MKWMAFGLTLMSMFWSKLLHDSRRRWDGLLLDVKLTFSEPNHIDGAVDVCDGWAMNGGLGAMADADGLWKGSTRASCQ